jgi:hypothetical protein
MRAGDHEQQYVPPPEADPIFCSTKNLHFQEAPDARVSKHSYPRHPSYQVSG